MAEIDSKKIDINNERCTCTYSIHNENEHRCEIQKIPQRTTIIFACDYIILLKKNTGRINTAAADFVTESSQWRRPRKKSYKYAGRLGQNHQFISVVL